MYLSAYSILQISVRFEHCLSLWCSTTVAVYLPTSCTGSFTETVLPEPQNHFHEAPCKISFCAALTEYATRIIPHTIAKLHPFLRLCFGVGLSQTRDHAIRLTTPLYDILHLTLQGYVFSASLYSICYRYYRPSNSLI